MLYHLRQHYAKKRLRIGISQHGRGFALSLRHGSYTRAVYLRKIRGIVQYKRYYNGIKSLSVAYPYPEKVPWPDIHRNKLQHKRRAAHKRYIRAR